ncbi:MAG: HDOD domain-containing protein [Clostridia bacterium]|nr:HDOD domain-containing protein [Clostridia bacterium]
MQIYVARQPILDRRGRIFGYELLFRSGLENVFACSDHDRASLSVLVNSFLAIGIDRLTGGKPAFVNFTENLIQEGIPALFPPGLVVVEILESVRPSEPVLTALDSLRNMGFSVALDDFAGQPRNGVDQFLARANIVKVDFLQTTPEQKRHIANSLISTGHTMVAEKVENRAVFNSALAAGYSLFQGYFFSRPEVRAGRDVSPAQINSVRLITEINLADPDFGRIAEAISHDLALSYRILRIINSAAYGLRYRITSIRRAIAMLGLKELRRWISLLTLASVIDDVPDALLAVAASRAKFAELLAPAAGIADRASELFLTGLFSVIDAILKKPMAEVISDLPLPRDVRASLVGDDSPLTPVHMLAVSYCNGAWADVERLCSEQGIDLSTLPQMYEQSVEWANMLTTSTD